MSAPAASHPRSGVRWLVRVGSSVLVVALAAWASHVLAFQRALQGLHETARQRLEVEAARLDGHLMRFEYLPSLLETAPDVMRLMDEPANAALRESVSRYLRTLNAIAGADNLYVLHRSGVALAAADFERPGTPVGEDLSYRPYMQDALAQGRGRFYGVGITSARAGYYLSYTLPARGDPEGVATVKVNLDDFEREWRELPGERLAIDEYGVVILASRDGWRYHPLQSLSLDALADARKARRYGDADLKPLDWQPLEQVTADGAARIWLDGSAYLMSERRVNHGRWRLLLLDDEAAPRAAARTSAISAGLGAAVLLLVVALAAERRRETRQRLASREALQAAHDSLEMKVQQRTAELRAAQDDLVHAGKLAVLGQMSAGIVHELNQPLAAMLTLADNAQLLIERDRPDEARSNLARIGKLVGRLGRLTSQLKVFAHKSSQSIGSVRVQKAVHEALSLVSARIEADGIAVSLRIEPSDLSVAGDEVRLEQVLVNLLSNSIDALAASDERRISIVASAEGSMGQIVVSNSGPCIDAAILPRLFEPFVTSKPAGKGLGLGLMISAHIVRGFGGSLRARNLSPAGAEFTITLPMAPSART